MCISICTKQRTTSLFLLVKIWSWFVIVLWRFFSLPFEIKQKITDLLRKINVSITYIIVFLSWVRSNYHKITFSSLKTDLGLSTSVTLEHSYLYLYYAQPCFFQNSLLHIKSKTTSTQESDIDICASSCSLDPFIFRHTLLIFYSI